MPVNQKLFWNGMSNKHMVSCVHNLASLTSKEEQHTLVSMYFALTNLV